MIIIIIDDGENNYAFKMIGIQLISPILHPTPPKQNKKTIFKRSLKK